MSKPLPEPRLTKIFRWRRASARPSISGTGSPNITTFVSRSSSPCSLAAPRWSTTLNNVGPLAAMSAVSRATTPSTDPGLPW